MTPFSTPYAFTPLVPLAAECRGPGGPPHSLRPNCAMARLSVVIYSAAQHQSQQKWEAQRADETPTMITMSAETGRAGRRWEWGTRPKKKTGWKPDTREKVVQSRRGHNFCHVAGVLVLLDLRVFGSNVQPSKPVQKEIKKNNEMLEVFLQQSRDL